MTQDKKRRGLTAAGMSRRVHRVMAVLMPLLFVLGSVQATQSVPPVAVGSTPGAWSGLDPIVAGQAIQRVESLLVTLPEEHRDALQSFYGDAGDVASWLPGLYDAFVEAMEQQQDGLSSGSSSSSSQSTLSELLDGLLTLDPDENPLVSSQYWDTVFTVVDGTLQSQGGTEKIDMARDMVIGVFGGDGQKEYRYPYPFPACPPMGPLVEDLIGEDPCTFVGIIGVVIAVVLAVVLGPTGIDPFNPALAADADADGMGDEWIEHWEEIIGEVLGAADDLDSDRLSNLDEFRWELIPVCVPTQFPNCQDYDDDGWLDGEEVWYWNDEGNDDFTAPGYAFYDPDRLLDTDGDEVRNAWDSDSDGDDLLDGDEFHVYGTYPEFADSDCSIAAVQCTRSKPDQSPYHGTRVGDPGTGDGLNDYAEVAAWDELMGEGSWASDLDGDGIPNLLDPDSDGDGLLDGDEHRGRGTHIGRFDTDNDGLLDGHDILVSVDDPRHTAFTQAGIVHSDLESGRLFRGEQSASTNPLAWDTDTDGLPDGYEVHYGLDPLNPIDAGLDPDQDGYNPDGDATPELPWTNLDEYLYGIPDDWSVPTDGVWWWGTDPTNPDTDGDGVLDGVEIHLGTDPTDGASMDPRGHGANGDGTEEVWRNDPTNDDVALDEMDEAQHAYLLQAEESAKEAMDEGLDHVPFSEGVRQRVDDVMDQPWQIKQYPALVANESTTLVSTTNDTVSALAKCAKETLQDPLGSNATSLVENATGCATETLVPFVDSLTDRTVSTIPDVTPLAETLQEEGVPATVDGAADLLPPELATATRQYVTNPASNLAQTTLDVAAAATNPETFEQPLSEDWQSWSQSQLGLFKASDRHPQFLHDSLAARDMAAQWELIADANEQVEQSSMGHVNAIATVDSLAMSLYTNRSGNERVHMLPLGNKTCVQLDDSAATRDAEGCDLYASATISAPDLEGHGVGVGNNILLGLRIEKAVANATYPLEALGYIQAPNAPYVLVTGYTATSEGPPVLWESSIDEYDASETRNRSLAFTVDVTNPVRLPMNLTVAGLKVDTNEAGKPIVPGNETILLASTPAMPSRMSFGHHVQPIGDAHAVDLSIGSSEESDWSVAMSDMVDEASNMLHVALEDLPAGSGTIHHVSSPSQAVTRLNFPDAVTRMDLGYEQRIGSSTLRTLQVNATDLASETLVTALTATHEYAYEASSSPSTLRFLTTEGTGSCKGLQSVAARFLFAKKTADSLCLSAHLDGYSQLRSTAEDDRVLVEATRVDALTGVTAVQLLDGNDVHVRLNSTPSQWSAQATKDTDQERRVEWDADAPVLRVDMQAFLDQAELIKAAFEGVPQNVQLQVSPRSGRTLLESQDYVDHIQVAMTTTGFVPGQSPGPGIDFARFRSLVEEGEVEPDYELAWDVAGAKRIQARVDETGAFVLDADLETPTTIETFFEDQGYRLAGSLASADGTIQIRLQPEDAAGRFQLETQATGSLSSATLSGMLPQGRINVELTDVPQTLTVITDLDAQRIESSANGAPGHVLIQYGAGEAYPEFASNGDFIVVQDDQTTGARGFHLDIASNARVVAEQNLGNIHLESDNDQRPILVRFDRGDDSFQLNVTSPPPVVDALQRPGVFEWSAPGSTSTDFGFIASLASEPRYVVASAVGATDSVVAEWSPKTATDFDAAVHHAGPGRIPHLTIQDYRGVPGATTQPAGNAGWVFDAHQLAPSTEITLEARAGRAVLASRDASGAALPSGPITAAFGDGVALLREMPPSYQGEYLLMTDAGDAASGGLRFSGVRELEADLFADATDAGLGSSLRIDQSAPADMYVDAESTSRGARMTLTGSNVPDGFALRQWPGSQAVDGFAQVVETSGSNGSFEAYLRVDDRHMVSSFAGGIPANVSSMWRAGQPFTFDAESPIHYSIKSSHAATTAPWRTDDLDFISQKNARIQDSERVNFGARISGIQDLELNMLSVNASLVSRGDATVNPVVVDFEDASGHVSLAASDLGASSTTSWRVLDRAFAHEATNALDSLSLQFMPHEEAIGRMHIALAGLPAGASLFRHDEAQRTLDVAAPSPIDEVRATFDRDSGPLSGLAERGVFADPDALRVNLSSVQAAAVWPDEATAGLRLHIERDANAAGVPARFQFEYPEQFAFAAHSSLQAGATRLAWPGPADAGNATQMRFAAQGVAGTTNMGLQASDGSRGRVEVVDAPDAFAFEVTPQGRIMHVGATGAARLSAQGVWANAAFDLVAHGVPTEFSVDPATDFAMGSVGASGPVGRFTLALATTGGQSGELPRVPSLDRDVFSVESTNGGGFLSVDMSDVQDLSWMLPGSADVDASPLLVTASLAAASTRPARVQVVHPDHQTRAEFPDGLPADLQLGVDRSLAAWQSNVDSTSKSFLLQHQDFDAGILRFGVTQPPSPVTAKVDPKAQRALTYQADAAAGADAVLVESSWGGGYLRADLEGLGADVFHVFAEDIKLQRGGLSTRERGSVDAAEVMFVPSGASTVNALATSGDFLAVESGQKSPYLRLKAQDFLSAEWQLPDAADGSPAYAALSRTTSTPGPTWIVASSPGNDLTAKFVDAAPRLRVAVDPKSDPSGAEPMGAVVASVGGTTGVVTVDHVNTHTGQAVHAEWTGLRGKASMLAGGGVAQPRVLSSGAAPFGGPSTASASTLSLMNPMHYCPVPDPRNTDIFRNPVGGIRSFVYQESNVCDDAWDWAVETGSDAVDKTIEAGQVVVQETVVLVDDIALWLLDAGVVVFTTVESATETLITLINRAVCETNSLVESIVSTAGTGLTGPLRIEVGKGGRVPGIASPEGMALMCSDGPSKRGADRDEQVIGLNADMPSLDDAMFTLRGDCEDSFEVPASNELRSYKVQGGPDGESFIETHAAFQTLEQGSIRFHVANTPGENGEPGNRDRFFEGGVRFDGDDDFSVLNQKLKLDTCQRFKTPVVGYQLNGTDVARDLHVVMNPRVALDARADVPDLVATAAERPSADPETMQIFSERFATDRLRVESGSIRLEVHIEPVENNDHLAQFRIHSPIRDWKLVVLDGSGLDHIPLNAINDDHLAVWQVDGLNYHIRLRDQEQFLAWIEIDCGKEVHQDLYSEKMPDRQVPHRFTAWSRQGSDCQDQRIDFEKWPARLHWVSDAHNARDVNTRLFISEEVDYMKTWQRGVAERVGTGMKHREWAYAEVSDMEGPASGKTFNEVELYRNIKSFFYVRAEADNGCPKVSLGGADDAGVAPAFKWRLPQCIDLPDLPFRFFAAVDLAGDTRFSKLPRYVHVDTDGADAKFHLMIDDGDKGLRLGTEANPVQGSFQDFQVQVFTKAIWHFEIPWFSHYGTADLDTGCLDFKVHNQWYQVPFLC